MVTRVLGGLVIATAMLGFGCDADHGGTPDTTQEGLTIAAFVPLLVRADCERQVRCESPAKYVSADACVAAYDPNVLLGWQRKVDAQAQGRVTFNAAVAASCLTAQASSCHTSSSEILGTCTTVTTGAVAVGHACLAHFECASEGVVRPLCFEGCVGLFGSEEPAGDGVCVAASPIGTPACP